MRITSPSWVVGRKDSQYQFLDPFRARGFVQSAIQDRQLLAQQQDFQGFLA